MPHAKKSSYAPSRWPSDVGYLRTMSYPPSLPLDVVRYIKGNRPAVPSSTKHHIAIRRIDTSAHPAHGQMGLFATKKIPPRTHIVDYFGELHTDDRPSSDYDLSLYRTHDDEGQALSVGIDAARMGNEARFINDYRGIKSKPNAVFKERRTEEGELRMSIWSGDGKAIGKGDEILVSYGKVWWQARSHEQQR
ncbi:hypothetical protein ACEPAF_3319 [Sanghuangporus sanghuang]|uniref:SET domain-containing protein n=1 Tax=Sanghuangporus baumii TaxID=108892 RepID=A0A9Q5HSP8_SANBA|nr:hypothetical protein A7U60_g7848 [Sanghuangporus baumii]